MRTWFSKSIKLCQSTIWHILQCKLSFLFTAVVVSLTPTNQHHQFQTVQVARTDTGETIQILSTDQHGNIIAAAGSLLIKSVKTIANS